MMKIIRAVVVVGLCFNLSGCATLMRIQGNEELDRPTDKRFVSTRYDIGMVAAVKDASKSAEARIACFVFPFALIDLPFAFVVDVIMLPLDWREYKKNKEDDIFWSSVIANPDRLPTVAECCEHASIHSRFFVYDKIYNDYDEMISGQSLHLIIQAASVMNDNLDRWMPFTRVLSHKNLLPASWIALYTYFQTQKYSEYFIEQLARNPVTPLEYYNELAKMDALKIKQSLTENSMTPSDILESIAQEASNSIQVEKGKLDPDTWNLYQNKRLLKSAESALAKRAD